SIRTFDASNQLSLKQHQFFSIVPNVQGKIAQEERVDIFEYLGESCTIWLSSFDISKKVLSEEYEKAQKIHSSLNSTVKYAAPNEMFFNGKDLESCFTNRSIIEFKSEKHFKASAQFNFKNQ